MSASHGTHEWHLIASKIGFFFSNPPPLSPTKYLLLYRLHMTTPPRYFPYKSPYLSLSSVYCFPIKALYPLGISSLIFFLFLSISLSFSFGGFPWNFGLLGWSSRKWGVSMGPGRTRSTARFSTGWKRPSSGECWRMTTARC